MRKKRIALAWLIITTLAASALTGCRPSANTGADQDQPLDALRTEAAFAAYHEVPVDLNPSIAAYEVAADLSNVVNKDRFAFSDDARSMLSKNGFLVTPSPMREFFSIYEINRYDMTPNFITTDSMMHNYHLYFDHLLRTLEKDLLRLELYTMTKTMLKKSLEQYEDLKGTDWENAAKRSVAYFAVADRLLDPKAETPAIVRSEVDDELRLISDHQQIAASPVMNMGNTDAGPAELLNEDYTQYIPRGHYTKSGDLKTYFQAMMWYGRLTFRAAQEDETKSAVLITRLLSSQQNYDRWNRIYETTSFFVGESDDLGFVQYYQLLTNIYGGVPSLDKLTGNEKQWAAFLDGIDKLDLPALNSIPIYNESIQSDREESVKGFRFMGQRFTPDASIFQRLVYREVKENSEGTFRMLPKGLDIPAAMGSEAAYSILKEMGETDYLNYPENMSQLQGDIESLDTGIWTQNLYWTWMFTLKPLTDPKGKGYPSFMQNQAWTLKQLETWLGSWTELKHDTILYAKQVYAEMGGGEEPLDDRGYVEPNPLVYSRLAALTRMTIDGLESRGLLVNDARTSLEELESLALQLTTISEKELAQKSLSDEEYELIRSYGGQLEHFWLQALSDEGVDHPSAIMENPAALIADVATDPNGQVLEEGTGFVNNIYAVVPVDGTLRIAKGAVYSYYEFPWPLEDRLTDEKWKAMLDNGETPEPPFWTGVYTAPEGASRW